MATVSADECPQARERAAALIDVLAVPPPVEVAPQRPVLYPPDEPDMP